MAVRALVVLALAFAAGPSAATRSDADVELHMFTEITGLADPPKAHVEEGLAAAKRHLADKEQSSKAALKAAEDKVAETNKAMQAALTSTNPDLNERMKESQAAFQAFQDAVRAKGLAEEGLNKAKELHGLVETHNTLTQTFFDAVKDFLQSRADSDSSRAMTDATELAQVQKAAQERLDQHIREEVMDVAELLKIYGEIETSTQLIKDKGTAINAAAVHAEVAKGTVKVKEWSDGELQPICRKYFESQDAKIKEVRESFTDGLPTCEKLLTALAAKFPKKIPGTP